MMLYLFDAVQRKIIKCIIDPTMSKLLLLAHRRAVGNLSLFYRYFNGFYLVFTSAFTHCSSAKTSDFSILSFIHSQSVKIMEPITGRCFSKSLNLQLFKFLVYALKQLSRCSRGWLITKKSYRKSKIYKKQTRLMLNDSNNCYINGMQNLP